MEKWARLYKSQVQFLMVCVDSKGVAIQFGKMFDIKCAVNGWIPSRGYMPRGYGQLGCSGFIISDTNGCFVSRKTQAYLQYGEDAFDHVENLLRKTFSIEPNASSSHSAGGEGDVLRPGWSIPSVGIPTMDKEHEECEEALSRLLLSPTVQTLTHVMEVLTEHFSHEEMLMRSSGFGKPEAPFSPYAGHVKDHERILDIGYVELAKYQEPNSSFLAVNCSETNLTEPHQSFLNMTCSATQDSGGKVSST
ncbi:hypothetical protein ACHAWF_014953 [Thalassiosira exigua]